MKVTFFEPPLTALLIELERIVTIKAAEDVLSLFSRYDTSQKRCDYIDTEFIEPDAIRLLFDNANAAGLRDSRSHFNLSPHLIAVLHILGLLRHATCVRGDASIFNPPREGDTAVGLSSNRGACQQSWKPLAAGRMIRQFGGTTLRYMIPMGRNTQYSNQLKWTKVDPFVKTTFGPQ